MIHSDPVNVAGGANRLVSGAGWDAVDPLSPSARTMVRGAFDRTNHYAAGATIDALPKLTMKSQMELAEAVEDV